MAIKRIKVSNYKSFNEIDLELGNFNVLIGANASGKSNFVSIFEFLRDIVNSEVRNAISRQGDIVFLSNLKLSTTEDLFIQLDTDDLSGRFIQNKYIIETNKTVYHLRLKFVSDEQYKIEKEKLEHLCAFYQLSKSKDEIKGPHLGDGKVCISKENNEISIDIEKPDKIQIDKDDLYPPFLFDNKFTETYSLIRTPLSFTIPLHERLSNLKIYDFEPKLPKKAYPVKGRAELEENGENLALILKKILEDPKKRRKFLNLIRMALPFIEDVETEKFADNSLLVSLEEKFYINQKIPAAFLSDGTITIVALIVALYFEDKPLIIIEEPERNIHPHLIARVVEMFKDASRKKQIIITTHNPEIVKHAELENLLLISRDEDGFSQISRPKDKETVQTFLSNDIGIDELYVQNLLED